MKTTGQSRVARTLNSLLKSEVLAAASYMQALPWLSDGRGQLEALRRIHHAHREAAQTIRCEIETVGGSAVAVPRVRPARFKSVDGPAKVFSDAVTLRTLQEVEEALLNEYSAAVTHLDGAGAQLIARTMLRAQLRHLEDIERALNAL